MKLATMTAIAALALAPAAFAQNTMSPAKAPMGNGGRMKHDTMMKSDAKEDMHEKKMTTHHRMMHHRKHHPKMHHMMKSNDGSMEAGKMMPNK